MVLSSSLIRARLENGTLGIEPFAEESLQPSSYDLRSAEDIVIKKQSVGGMRPEELAMWKRMLDVAETLLLMDEYTLSLAKK